MHFYFQVDSFHFHFTFSFPPLSPRAHYDPSLPCECNDKCSEYGNNEDINNSISITITISSMTSVWNMVTVIKSTIVFFQYRVDTEGTNVDSGSITSND